MFYRRKFYIVKSEFVEKFNELFHEINLPNQLKYGSKLVGRWMMDRKDGTTEVFAIWEYDSYESYESIEKNVRSDEAHLKRIENWYNSQGGKAHVFKEYFIEVRNEALESTVKENILK
ncbi:NIPSNAP family protein [Falsibacillus pallidus]|uniref:NIPSNAP family protein n=1 Tax=Falsibacillus pallidus TaxID=493781 RepID=UPI003D95F5E2